MYCQKNLCRKFRKVRGGERRVYADKIAMNNKGIFIDELESRLDISCFDLI